MLKNKNAKVSKTFWLDIDLVNKLEAYAKKIEADSVGGALRKILKEFLSVNNN